MEESEKKKWEEFSSFVMLQNGENEPPAVLHERGCSVQRSCAGQITSEV